MNENVKKIIFSLESQVEYPKSKKKECSVESVMKTSLPVTMDRDDADYIINNWLSVFINNEITDLQGIRDFTKAYRQFRFTTDDINWYDPEIDYDVDLGMLDYYLSEMKVYKETRYEKYKIYLHNFRPRSREDSPMPSDEWYNKYYNINHYLFGTDYELVMTCYEAQIQHTYEDDEGEPQYWLVSKPVKMKMSFDENDRKIIYIRYLNGKTWKYISENSRIIIE